MVQLYDVVQSSFKDANQQRSNLEKHGYKRDDEISNHNRQVYFNPEKNDLIYNITGSHNLKDLGTNLYLAAGHIKNTNRYFDEHKGLRQVKEKYKVVKATVSGYSLGGTLAGYVGSKSDNIVTLNKGSTIGQRVRSGENAFRVGGDLVSLMNKNSKHMKTLKNQNMTTPFNALKAHSSSNIKNYNIKI
jgi:hypothetical protein